MHITKDPRCPQHPDMEVFPSYHPAAHMYSLVWVCAACHRPLGLARLDARTIRGIMSVRTPANRRVLPADISIVRKDWVWITSRMDV